ncbi:MAG: hypothetical protein FWB86_09120 [Treponema sp.]|nr:hypothetical protein [Treponema sp.]MCL2272747.1 hypothetical protein [Treponema sp.]
MGLGGMIAGAAVDAAAKKVEMAQRLKGRTPEQQKVIKYFYQAGGCLSKCINDEEYESMIMTKAKSMDFKQKALDKHGLDESQVKEVEPIHLENYMFDDKKAYAKRGKDGIWRSSAYQITWIFSSSTQVYVYQYTFNLDEDGKKERTEEYFYKDITNFSTTSELIEKEVPGKTSCTGKTEYIRTTVDTNLFQLVVPGDKFLAAMQQNDYTEKAVQAIKAKLREKKG